MKSILTTMAGALLFLTMASEPAASAETKPDFAHWENEIAAFERADATNPPPKNALLFIGSSTIRLWHTLAPDLPGQTVINRGFGGSTIKDSTHFAARIIFPYAPRQIFLRAGGNDLWSGQSVGEVFTNFQEFVSTVHAQLPKTEIVFISLSPSPARWKQAAKEKALNDLVADFVRGKNQLRYLETYDVALGTNGQPSAELFIGDQLHFNAHGYRLLAERVRKFLAETK